MRAEQRGLTEDRDLEGDRGLAGMRAMVVCKISFVFFCVDKVTIDPVLVPFSGVLSECKTFKISLHTCKLKQEQGVC